jgi:lysophospholipase L1-like esterase
MQPSPNTLCRFAAPLRRISIKTFVALSVAPFLAGSIPCFAQGGAPDQPIPCIEKIWLGKHHYLSSLVLQQSRRPRLDLYFLGDSITEDWKWSGKDVWKQEYGDLHTFNAGISGDKAQNILYRINQGEFDRIAPKVVVLLAGINNFGASPNLNPADLARGLKAIVNTLRTKSPTTKVLLLSTLPSGPANDPLRAHIRATDEILATFADGKGVFYLDIYDKFLNAQGEMPDDVSPDGTHLYAKGYQIWAEAMRPLLKTLLESPDPE